MIRRYIAWRNRHETHPRLREIVSNAPTGQEGEGCLMRH